MEGELKNALKVGKSSPVMLDPKVLKTLVSYLEHLDYIHKHEVGEGDKAGLPPKVPDHLRSGGYKAKV